MSDVKKINGYNIKDEISRNAINVLNESIVKKKIIYENVDSMINDENIVEGDKIETLGFYEINDGGAATYYVREKIEQEEIDNVSVIQLYNSDLVAEINPYQKEISLKQFGCYGDGIHDDSTNIQKAINYFASKKCKINKR